MGSGVEGKQRVTDHGDVVSLWDDENILLRVMAAQL